MRPKIKRIYVSWRASAGARRIIVGEIKISSQNTCFKYLKSNVEMARKDGFVCYPDFPDINKIYNVNVTRVFAQRVNNQERSDINDYYSFWEIAEKERQLPMRMLAHTNGVLPTDNFEFLVEYYGLKDLTLVSEIAGLSHSLISSDLLNEGEELCWKLEPYNEFDKKAVALYSGDTKLGYIKQIHNRLFHIKGADRLRIFVKRIERNGHINKAYIVIKYDKYK